MAVAVHLCTLVHRRNYRTQGPGRSNYDHVDDNTPSKTTWEMVCPAPVIGIMLPCQRDYMSYLPPLAPCLPSLTALKCRRACQDHVHAADRRGQIHRVLLPADWPKLSSRRRCAACRCSSRRTLEPRSRQTTTRRPSSSRWTTTVRNM